MDKQRVEAAVVEAIAQCKRLEPSFVRRDALLEAELNVDSLAMIEIAIELEERLGYRAPDAGLVQELGLRTVGDLIAVIERHLNGEPIHG
jgi:acyl carrier protein